MNEDIKKFKETIKGITEELDVLCYMLESKVGLPETETVAEKLELYEDNVGLLKGAFDTLRAEAGSLQVRNL